MKLGIKKGNERKISGNVPQHYPADRVYLDGDISKNVQEFKDNLVKKIDITAPSTGNTVQLTLPSGFTTSNCIPLNILRHSTEDYFVQDSNTTVYYAGSVAYLYYSDGQRGKSMSIYFMKIG